MLQAILGRTGASMPDPLSGLGYQAECAGILRRVVLDVVCCIAGHTEQNKIRRSNAYSKLAHFGSRPWWLLLRVHFHDSCVVSAMKLANMPAPLSAPG